MKTENLKPRYLGLDPNRRPKGIWEGDHGIYRIFGGSLYVDEGAATFDALVPNRFKIPTRDDALFGIPSALRQAAERGELWWTCPECGQHMKAQDVIEHRGRHDDGEDR